MATYDPQRSHSRQRVTDDQPAAVDALLDSTTLPGAAPDPGIPAGDDPEVGSGAGIPRVVDLDDPAPSTNAVEGRAGAVRLLLAGAAIAAAAAVVVMLRRRRRRRGGPSPDRD